MHAFIIYKNQSKVKYLSIILLLVFALSCSQQSASQPKYWEYSEVTGTIRRLANPNKNKSLVGYVLCRFCSYFCKAAFIFAGALCLGLPKMVLLWMISSLLLRKILLDLAHISEISERDQLKKVLGKAAICVGSVGLLGVIVLTMFTIGTSGSVDSGDVALAQVQSLAVAGEGRDLRALTRQLVRVRRAISIQDQQILYQKLSENCQAPSPQLFLELPHLKITVGQLNRIRKEWGLSRRQGRPGKSSRKQYEQSPVKSFTCLPKIGAHLFDMWLENEEQYQETLQAIYKHVERYKLEHPDESFRLLHARKDAIARKWKALMMLPLLGIEKLTELDYCQHDLPAVTGYSYKTSTLTQFLGELERVTLACAFNPVLGNGARGGFCYIDGHKIAFWTRLKMHKGLVTMLGRIMAGSNAVVAHDQFGQAIGLEYHPPDMHLGHIIDDYCNRITDLTGIKRFIIDREINSLNTAQLFSSNHRGLICLLDANEYKGLSSFNRKSAGKLEDGTILYRASWKPARIEDPRCFVIALEPDRCIVYWCTPDIARQYTARQIVMFYRMRAEVQENSFKSMISHGALNTNYGIKKVWSDDRTHQRKIAKHDEKIEKINGKEHKLEHKIDEQITKVEDSLTKQHGALLYKRVAKLERLENQQDDLKAKILTAESQKQKLGPPIQRADRDFRKQAIMTCRTLFLENALRKFTALLSRSLESPINVDIVLDLFFRRRGMMIECDQKVSYLIDSNGLSRKYQQVLKNIAEGFNRCFHTHRGKAVSLELAGFT